MQGLLICLSEELSSILKVKVRIAEVTGADHFYTDGMSVGAAWRIGLPDSDLNFIRADGSVHMACSNLWTETICEFIRLHLASLAAP
jgi:hypothetical protein